MVEAPEALDHVPAGIIFEPLKLIYVSIPKVACSTIKTVLSQWAGLGGSESVNQKKWTCVEDLKEAAGAGYHRIAFVRNPYDRLVSCWEDKFNKQHAANSKHYNERGVSLYHASQFPRLDGASFAEFCELVCDLPDRVSDDHWRSQSSFLLRDGELAVDWMGRFEYLEQDLIDLARTLGKELSPDDIPHIFKSDRLPYQSYYSQDLVGRVGLRYRSDLDFFNYKFEDHS